MSKEYKVSIPEGKYGDQQVERFTVSQEDEQLQKINSNQIVVGAVHTLPTV